jgi:predicted metal-dependent hydrolase
MTVPPYYRDLNRGIDLFNSVRFFDAHEELEDIWRTLPRDHPSRRHAQGLVQMAVAFHHASTGNRTGARSVLERAIRNLEGADASFPELDLAQLQVELEHWQHHLTGPESRLNEPDIGRSVIASSVTAPALPKILRRR